MTVHDVMGAVEGRKTSKDEDIIDVPFRVIEEAAAAPVLDLEDLRVALGDAVVDPAERVREAIRSALKL